MPVEALLESFLVEEVADEADTASKHKHPIKRASLDVCLSLVLGEEPTEKSGIRIYVKVKILKQS